MCLRSAFCRTLVPLACLLAGAPLTQADTPDLPALSLNTYEGWSIQSSGDIITNSHKYLSQRVIHAEGSVQTFTTNAVAPIADLLMRFKLAPGQCYQDESINVPAYAVWSAGQTSLIVRLAQPLTTGALFNVDCNVVGTQGLQQPLVSFCRSASPILIPPSTVITQTLVLTLTVPAGALSGYSNMLIQVDDWDHSSSGVQLGLVSCSAPPEFQISTNNNLPEFASTNAFLLAGAYVFTNRLTVTNSSPSQALQFVPGVSAQYSQFQQFYHSSVQSSVTHAYANGSAVTLSAAQPLYLSSMMNQHQCRLALRSKWAATNATPNVSQIYFLFFTEQGLDGSTFQSLMLSADGSDIVAASLVVPSNTNSYDLYNDNGTIRGETAYSDTNDLAEFTNGTYTLNLLDFSNNVVATYDLPLQGQTPAEMLTLLSPGSSTTNAMPEFRWTMPAATNFNFGALDVENLFMPDGDLYFWSMGTTNYTETNAVLFGNVQTQLIEGDMQETNAGGADVRSGWMSVRDGLVNVISNGFQLADAHLATSEYRVNVSNDVVHLWTANSAFFGTNGTTATLDFGDGTQPTNAKTADHVYRVSGVYTARLVVAANGGGPVVTNSIVLTVYPLPTVSGISAPQGSSPAQLSFSTVSNALYQVFRATSLLPDDWSPLAQSPTTGDGSITTVSDPDSATTQRFYRLQRTLPQP